MRMITATTLRRGGLALVIGGLTGCSEPAPAPAKAAPVEPAAPEEECRDWSSFDVDGLAPLVEGAEAPLLDAVWRRVLEKHYDPTLGCLHWVKLREVYARKVAEAATPEQAFGHINAMLGELGQSHLRLFPRRAPDRDSLGPAAPALTVRWVEDQLVVVHSAAEGPQGPVPAGATLLAIDDQAVQGVVERVRVSSDPHAFPLEVARAVTARLSCQRAGQVHKLKINDAEDHLAIRVVPCLAPQGERVTLGNLRDIPTHVEHRMLEGQVGYLAFNVWMLPMVKRVQAALEELREQGMRALVLDLRGNPGGVGAMAIPVARLLLPREGSLGTLRFRDFEQQLVVDHVEGAFIGPVAVLVDEGTASTSEIFIVGLRDQGRVTVVGARSSAGAALPSVIEELEGGALLQYVVADYRSPKGTVVEGQGIVPDVHVVETREAFAAGRDPVLEAAHEHLAKMVPAGSIEPSGDGPKPLETAG